VFSLASETFNGLDDGLKGNPTSFMQALERQIPLNECLQVDFDKTICSPNFLLPKSTLTKINQYVELYPQIRSSTVSWKQKSFSLGYIRISEQIQSYFTHLEANVPARVQLMNSTAQDQADNSFDGQLEKFHTKNQLATTHQLLNTDRDTHQGFYVKPIPRSSLQTHTQNYSVFRLSCFYPTISLSLHRLMLEH
jgi:hypothetical protein